MRRHAKPEGLAQDSSARALDVDPHHLPARFALPVNGTPGRPVREPDTITISNDCVAVEQATADGRTRRQLAVRDFAGVAVRFDRLPEDGRGVVITVNLQHDDPELCIPLHIATDMTAVAARWQSWGRALKLPLLLPAEGGGWREPDEYPGKLIVRAPSPRPARLALKSRRSLYSAVREVGDWGSRPILSETEIIARR